MPRLYVEADLNEGETIALDEAQARYLGDVMRLKAGALVQVFNGRDGEFAAQLGEVGKRVGEHVSASFVHAGCRLGPMIASVCPGSFGGVDCKPLGGEIG